MKPPEIHLETHTDRVAGYQIFSRTCASANDRYPPIVLVHGLAMSSRYMTPIARNLAPDFQVYAPDLPGFGRSQKTEKALPLPQLAAVLQAYLDAQGLRQVALLGNSMGCQIIAEFVLQNPGRALAVVMVGPTMDPRIRSLISALGHGFWNMVFEPPSFYPVLVRDYFTYGARRTFQTIEDGFHDPIEARLPRMHLPVLVVRGQHDQLCSQPWVEKVTALLPQGRLVVVPGAAHVVNFDAANKLGQLIRQFLA